MSTAIVRSVAELRARVAAWHAAGERVGLIPTMGALHEGHQELIRAAGRACARKVVTIFVNPRQFGPNEDFARYPRQEEADQIRAADAGADLIFAPGVGEMYPDGYATSISVSGVSDGLCGAHRPGHFAGVATVVGKLLIQAGADEAFFGEKDYQQLQVVRRLVRDLDIPVRITGVPTVREADGLALSSRNVYLSAGQRALAPLLAHTLNEMARRIAAGAPIAATLAEGLSGLRGAGFDEVEYLEARDAVSLVPITALTAPGRLLVAARLGKTRLIDNVPVLPKAAP